MYFIKFVNQGRGCEVKDSFIGFIKFWTDADTGILSLPVFRDYKRLERIFNSSNWDRNYHKQEFLTEDLKWLHKRVVYGLVNHPSINYRDVTESIFIRKMRQWLSIVYSFSTLPSLQLNAA